MLKLKTQFRRYAEYKDSGIDWIGAVPTTWNVEKLKYKTALLNGFSFDSENYVDNGLSIIRIGDVGQAINFDDVKKYPESFRVGLQKFRIKNGDILVALTGATIGKMSVYKNNEEAYLNQRVGIIRPRKELFLNYLKHIVSSPIFKENIDYYCMGGAQENIGKKEIGNILHALPMLRDQQKIADYLDVKTAIIDKIIEQKQKLIELLKEKRAAVINKAITRGLDENVELIDSGIEWIGKIPKGWKVEKLRFVAPLRNNKIDIKYVLHETYIGLENIESGTGKIININEDLEVESLVNTFNQGDVLFGKLRPYLEKVLQPNFSGVCTSELLVLIPQLNKVTASFIFYRLFSKDFIKIVNNSTYGTKMPRASWDFIGNLLIAYPETAVQKKITLYLDAEINNIDQLAKKIKKSIELLQEYKSSLIYNVVTGKVKVVC